jgi:glycosyltransferase involved in cell wall biosynthesis
VTQSTARQLKIAFNAAGVKLGGILTYFRQIFPLLHEDSSITALAIFPAAHVEEFRCLAPRFDIRPYPYPDFLPFRMYWDLRQTKGIYRTESVDAAFTTNFGMLIPPCARAFWLRNALYFSRAYERYLKERNLMLALGVMRLRRRWAEEIARHSDILLFSTNAMRDEVLDRWTWYPMERTRIIPFGHEHILQVTASEKKRQYLSSKYISKCCPGKTLFFPSLPGHHKNLSVVLEALRIAGREEPKVRLLLPTVQGFHVDIPENVAPFVIPVEMLDAEAMKIIYTEADMVLFPSFCESFGLPLLEAMACHTPILAADIPTSREICGEAAIYLPPFDASAWGQAILALIRHPDRAGKLTQAGTDRVKHFSWCRHVEALVTTAKEISG